MARFNPAESEVSVNEYLRAILNLLRDGSADGTSLNSVWKSTAGGAALNQSIKTFSSNGGTADLGVQLDTIVYTVTSGKTFYVTDILVTLDDPVARIVSLKAAGIVVVEAWVSTTAPMDTTGIESQPTISGGNTLSIHWPITSGKHGTFFIAGFEQ